VDGVGRRCDDLLGEWIVKFEDGEWSRERGIDRRKRTLIHRRPPPYQFVGWTTEDDDNVNITVGFMIAAYTASK
jgi:hypothetical protein